MKIGIIVPPFISVPPVRYGGTELFVAHLAEGLRARGHWPVVYTVGTSTVGCEIRWRKARGEWPIQSPLESNLDDLEHSSWACQDAGRDCDVLHLNNAPGLHLSRFVERPFVYTLHHPHEPPLSRFYGHYPQVQYVAISHDQARRETMARLTTIHHGLRMDNYHVGMGRRDYLCFIGRIAPIKGTHNAIAVARRAGMKLKIAGEIQPMYQEYWDTQIRPHVDGRNVEYVGELGLEGKNELLGGARAMLFPIEWEEPFGLVLTEAMACGTPVLGFARGSAPEIIADGRSGWICRDVADMARRACETPVKAAVCRQYVEENFSLEQMVESYLDVYQAGMGRRALPPAPRLHEMKVAAPLRAAS